MRSEVEPELLVHANEELGHAELEHEDDIEAWMTDLERMKEEFKKLRI